MKLKFLRWFRFSTLVFPVSGLASPGIFPDATYTDNVGGSYRVTGVEECRQTPVLSFSSADEAMTCRAQRAFRAGIEASSITLGICSTASPLPMQAKVVFGVTSVALQVATFVLSHIPCDG